MLHFSITRAKGTKNLDLTLYSESIVNDHDITTRKTRKETFVLALKGIRTQYREYLAEFLGTLVLVMLVCGLSAEKTLNVDSTRSALTSSVAAGFALLAGICISGHISGGHINPAVTVTLAVFCNFPFRKVPGYILSQFLGAFTGAALLYSIIEPAITQFDHGERQIAGEFGTAGIFGTYAPDYVGIASAFASEIVGTALFLVLILATGHQGNTLFHAGQAIMISASLLVLILCLGFTSGFSLNPARDLGPRFFAAIAGWSFDVFSVNNYYFFVPMFGPIIGGLLGGVVYMIFVD
ncbi:aquaporin-like protein [Pilobolus umbonatus]|nr:aquaporin-like protein [Pilobolus umbonatus]